MGGRPRRRQPSWHPNCHDQDRHRPRRRGRRRRGILAAPSSPLFKLGLGARLGNGRQWTSWVALDDEIAIVLRALDDAGLSGPVNATSPNPVRNAELTDAVARAVGRRSQVADRRPCSGSASGSGAADSLLLAGQRVMPQKLDRGRIHPRIRSSRRRPVGSPRAGRRPMTTDWNFADVWETCADVRGDAPALSQGPSAARGPISTAAQAAWRGSCSTPGSPPGQGGAVLYNGNEYLETVFAALKASLVPVNTNYRYGDEELALPLGQRRRGGGRIPRLLRRRVARLRPLLPKVKAWLHVDDGTEPCPGVGHRYEDRQDLAWAPATTEGPARGGRSGDDLCLLYTGGHDGHAEGRHVAPGRPVRRDERRQPRELPRDGRTAGESGVRGGVDRA